MCVSSSQVKSNHIGITEKATFVTDLGIFGFIQQYFVLHSFVLFQSWLDYHCVDVYNYLIMRAMTLDWQEFHRNFARAENSGVPFP